MGVGVGRRWAWRRNTFWMNKILLQSLGIYMWVIKSYEIEERNYLTSQDSGNFWRKEGMGHM